MSEVISIAGENLTITDVVKAFGQTMDVNVPMENVILIAMTPSGKFKVAYGGTRNETVAVLGLLRIAEIQTGKFLE